MTDQPGQEQVGNWTGANNTFVTTKKVGWDHHEVHAVRVLVKDGDTAHGGDTLGLVIQTEIYVADSPWNRYHQKIWRATWGSGSLGGLTTFGEAVDFIWNNHLRESS